MENQDPKNSPNLKEAKTEVLLEESKVSTSKSSIIENTPPKLLAWCSWVNNQISIIDIETKQKCMNFGGAQRSKEGNSWTHVKEIPNTNLLVSLNHLGWEAANMEIYDISKKAQAKKIYSFGEISGVAGNGDVTYNVRRNILGAIPLKSKIAYHLFSIDANASYSNHIVKLNRKSKSYLQYSDGEENSTTGLDFNPIGECAATIDKYGVCLISDVNTASYCLYLNLEMRKYNDDYGHCRWSSNTSEPLLYIKYDWNKLIILDTEKALTLKNPVQLENGNCYTLWIDVCQNNGNLLASGGQDHSIKIFDKRESKIVKIFDEIHEHEIYCVRWSPSGDMIASASYDMTVKLLDFKTGKIIHTGNTSDGSRLFIFILKRFI